MTKGDLIGLAEIIQADIPRMATKDLLAEKINERLNQIKAQNFKIEISKQFAPPAASSPSKTPAETESEVEEPPPTIFYLSVVGTQGRPPFSVPAMATMRVQDLKLQIAAVSRIPVKVMRLLYQDGDLENHKCLHEHGILADAQIRLFESKLDGGKKMGRRGTGNPKQELKEKDFMKYMLEPTETQPGKRSRRWAGPYHRSREARRAEAMVSHLETIKWKFVFDWQALDLTTGYIHPLTFELFERAAMVTPQKQVVPKTLDWLDLAEQSSPANLLMLEKGGNPPRLRLPQFKIPPVPSAFKPLPRAEQQEDAEDQEKEEEEEENEK